MILTVGSTYAGVIDAFGYAVNKINEGGQNSNSFGK